MKAGLGVRLVAGAAVLAGALAATVLAGAAAFLAGAALVAGVAFLAGAAAFLAGVFFAVAMMKFLWSEVSSPLINDLFSATEMLMEKVALSKRKNHFSVSLIAEFPSPLGFLVLVNLHQVRLASMRGFKDIHVRSDCFEAECRRCISCVVLFFHNAKNR
jgi:hypothetical protein